MNNCAILGYKNDKIIGWNSTNLNLNLNLKVQKIVSSSYTFTREIIGYEILLDFSSPPGVDVSYLYFINGQVLDYTLNYLYKMDSSVFKGKTIFINVDRTNLCNKITLKKIALLSSHLIKINKITLVVEITERNLCGKCIQIADGLAFLKNENVKLAIDDYDIYKGDFRTHELIDDIYEYIKIDAPQTELDCKTLNDFITHRNEKIIIERIENNYQLREINTTLIYGLQGYLFDYGRNISSLNSNH
ncbi:hypothetical protein [Aeromonas enteropelogenes]|uniref:hypothetical protein n=1 Tax=Aeromonas enteropelogenes TaxID=29489 RepID=UPI003B9F708E